MLIILNGIETVHKKYISACITTALNNFKVGDYTIKVTHTDVSNTIEVYDQNNVLVHSADGTTNTLYKNSDGSVNDSGLAVWASINQFVDTTLRNTQNASHYANVFVNLNYDFGLTSVLETDQKPSTMYVNDTSYQGVLNNYNNRLWENFVITGSFGKWFIDKIKNDLGEANVQVINIIRNPSTAFYLNQKDTSYYTVLKPGNTTLRTPELDYNKLVESILNSAILKDVPNVTTVSFEDILTSGNISVLGKDCPVNMFHQNYNDIITVYEQSSILTYIKITDQQLATFNNEFSNFAYYTVSMRSEDLLETWKIQIDPNTSYTIDQLLAFTETDFINNVIAAGKTQEKAQILYNRFNVADIPYHSKNSLSILDLLENFNTAQGTLLTPDDISQKIPTNIFSVLSYEPLTISEITQPKP